MIDMNCDKTVNPADPIIKPAPRGFVSYNRSTFKICTAYNDFICLLYRLLCLYSMAGR